MNPRIYLVITMAVLVLIICFFMARIYIYGFRVGSHPARGILLSSVIVAVVYLSSLFSARNASRFGKTVYVIINIIAGFFFYLFLGAIVLGLVSVGYAIGGHDVPLAIVWSIFDLAVLSALVGFIQARYIVTTRYTVTLKNALASWQGKTAVLISDTHFGLINYTRFAKKITRKILALKPDFILHAGDFYDGPIVPTEPITAIWKDLITQIPMFYTPGNHEAYGDYKKFVQSVRDAGATVLDDKLTEYDGVQIAGTLYHPGKEPKEVAEALHNLSIDTSKATILINHPPTAFEAPLAHGVNLIVSGHTHQGQFWPLHYITHLVYGVYDYGMHPYKDLTSITSTGIGTYGPAMRLFNSPEIVVITFNR